MLFVTSLAANVAFEGHTSSIFFLLPFRVFEFCIGGLISELEREAWHVPRPLEEAGASAGIVMILISYTLFDATTGFPSLPALLPCAGTALIIVCGNNRISQLVLSNSGAVYVGSRSYSLYLVHWPIAVFFTYAASNPWGWKTGLWLAVVSLAASELLYRSIEQPFRYPTRGASLSNRRFIPHLMATTLLVIIVSMSVAQSGWRWRLGSRAFAYDRLAKETAVAYGGDGCGNSCETNPGEPIAAFVIGDSNAQQYFAGLKTAFPDRNFRILQFSSCPFFSHEFTRDFKDYPDPKLYDEGCRAARAQAFSEISRSHAALIVSQNWVNFPLVSEKSGKKLRFSEFADAISFYANQLLELRHDLGARSLLVIGTIPGAPENHGASTDCIFRPVLFDRGCENAPPDARRQANNALFSSVLRDSAVFLDPFDALCDKTMCRTFDDIAPIYSDANHLTLRGSELVMFFFRQKIEDALSEK